MTSQSPPREAPYPLQRHLGFRVTDWRIDYCRLELPLQGFLMNRQGIPHGGIHATLMDTAMGFSGCFSDDPERPRYAMTLNLSVNFLGLPEGDLLITQAWRTGGGQSTFFADAKVTDEHQTVLASATGVFRYRKKFTKGPTHG